MGGLKGAAKRSLAEKSPSRTGKQGGSMAGEEAGVFPSALLVWSAGLPSGLSFRLVVWDNAVLCQTIRPCSVCPSVWSGLLVCWPSAVLVCLLPSAFRCAGLRLVWSGLLSCSAPSALLC